MWFRYLLALNLAANVFLVSTRLKAETTDTIAKGTIQLSDGNDRPEFFQSLDNAELSKLVNIESLSSLQTNFSRCKANRENLKSSTTSKSCSLNSYRCNEIYSEPVSVNTGVDQAVGLLSESQISELGESMQLAIARWSAERWCPTACPYPLFQNWPTEIGFQVNPRTNLEDAEHSCSSCPAGKRGTITLSYSTPVSWLDYALGGSEGVIREGIRDATQSALARVAPLAREFCGEGCPYKTQTNTVVSSVLFNGSELHLEIVVTIVCLAQSASSSASEVRMTMYLCYNCTDVPLCDADLLP